jgi:two-component system phosphate regulon sensor histidine kinase PhoR
MFVRHLFNSIRWRITIPFLGVFLFILAVLVVYFSNFLRDIYQQQLETQLISESRLLSETASSGLQARDSAALQSAADHYSGLLGVRVTFIDLDGVVLADSSENPRQMDNHSSRPEIQQALYSGQGTAIRFSDTLKTDMLYGAIEVLAGDSLLGFVRLAVPLDFVNRNIASLQQTVLGISLAAAVLVLVLSALIASRTTLPLRELTDAARRFDLGDLDATLLPTGNDEVGRLTASFNEMTTRLREQLRALQEERGKLAAVLARMTDGVIIIDDQGKVRLVNPAAMRMFASGRPELTGHSAAEVLWDPHWLDLWNVCRQTGRVQSAAFETGSGHEYLQGTAIPFEEPLPGSVLCIFQDLSRLRRLETVRRDFMSNIAHELRTPLASLKALTETLQIAMRADPESAKKFLLQMETEIDALVQLVREALELSLIESGRAPLERKPVSPGETIRSAASRMELQADRAGLHLNVVPVAGLPDMHADPRRIEEVLVILLHNAIKFTPPGGTVQIRTETAGPDIRISVIDTGMGIPVQDLERIFERFYKADQSRASGGTGLGLAIAKHIVELHGGHIGVESVEGRGSTFFFTIPQAGS